jgi:hypothetical protein
VPIPKDLKFGDILHGDNGNRYIVGVCSSWFEADGVTLREDALEHFPYNKAKTEIYCLAEGEKDGDMGVRLDNGYYHLFGVIAWERV